MNRLFVITVGSLEVRGLISPGELPDVVTVFYRTAERHGATPSYPQPGTFLAVKGRSVVKLVIGPYHQAIPSKMISEVLEDLMAQAFQY